MTNSIEDNQIAELLTETSKIAWKDLQVFFAGGKVIYISTELDLIEVAAEIARDNRSLVEQWMQNTQVAPVSDSQARQWYRDDASVWAVVVKPWVLVQDVIKQPDKN